MHLRIFAARGNPQHADALLDLLQRSPDDMEWVSEVLVDAVIELGERASAILPYLEDCEEGWVVELVEKVKTPWEDLEGIFSNVAQNICATPSLWPDLVGLIREEPGLLDVEDDDALWLLYAVAYGRCPVGDLMPKLIEIGTAQEAWMTLLALGAPARPAIEAHLSDGDLDDDAQAWLTQVRDLL
ncbi:MAG: hypothetical protein ACI8RZ_005709 [Myxococcota bacterium]|jgi:hypothetical protein